DISAIGQLAHDYKIPFHVDAVQTFGKYSFDPNNYNADAFSVSFHKMYGPPGIGLLVIRKSFMEGYKLRAQICGSQNDGLRGGTENVSLIYGSLVAMKLNFMNS